MKLDKLWIGEFKNLKDFFIDFDEREQSLFTVMVGWNGTGKTNVFIALATIFKDLYYEYQTSFAYKLEYICHDKRIKITNDPNTEKSQDRLKKEWKPLKGKGEYEPIKANKDEYLPDFVFGYYSGPSDRLKEPFLQPRRDYYDQVLRIESKYASKEAELRKLRKFFYAEQAHSKFVLLAFFLQRDEKINRFLYDYFRIVDLDSVLFILKEPPWAKKRGGDQRFWGAQGLVQHFLNYLYPISLAPMRLKLNKPSDTSKRPVRQDSLCLFIKDGNTLSKLASDFNTPSEFFARLESTHVSQLIDDVHIKVKIRNYDGTLTFRELSEGEQQLLMVLGLLRFTKAKESLILLDEPDTHLNPFWSAEYLDLLQAYVNEESDTDEGSATRHIIMSTHDPLVIAGLDKEQIQILKRDEQTDQCSADIPIRSPRGMGFEGILTSDMFGFRSALDKPTLKLLDEKRRLTIKENLTESDLKRLDELNEQIGDLDFSNVVRDDHYKMFTRAMTEFEEQNQITERILTPEQIRQRKEYARKLAARLTQETKQKKS